MNKKQITSPQNHVIKNIKELQKKKSARKKERLFIVEGIRAVKEIPSQANIKYVLTTPDVDIATLMNLNPHTWIEVSQEVYKSMSETQSPQGAMAVVTMPDQLLEEQVIEEGNYLLLENVQDPGNLGTIIRTAHAFGFKGVFITKGSVDVYSPKVVRSTMSSLFYVPLVIDYTIEEYIHTFKQAGVSLYAAALTDQAKPIYSLPFDEKKAIIIGNEGNGVSEEVLAATDYTMIIPMPGGAESLNASVATAICMYEITKPKKDSL